MNAAIGGAFVGVVPGVLKKNARVGAVTSVVAAVAMGAATFWFDDLACQPPAFNLVYGTVC